jgi:hypothetical protein
MDVFRQDLFGPGSPVIFEISSPEIVLFTTAYHFTIPIEMAHHTDTTSVPTRFTTVGLAPINTSRTPNVTPTLPPRYCVLNASIPTSMQTSFDSPSGPSSSGHSLPSFILTLPQFPFGGPSLSSIGSLNPTGTILSFTPHYQIPVGGQFHQGGMNQPPLSGKIPIGANPNCKNPNCVNTNWNTTSNWNTAPNWNTTFDRRTDPVFWTKHTSILGPVLELVDTTSSSIDWGEKVSSCIYDTP